MAMTATQMNRVFIYGSARLPDPDPAMPPEDVKAFYSHMHPELLTAEITGPETKGDTLEYTFRKAVGTKG